MKIAVIGGTGPQGRGLAMRWARAGHEVIVGSRDAERAADSATELSRICGAALEGLGNAEAAAAGEIVVLTVPFSAHVSTLQGIAEQLQGKILLDVSVPLHPENPKKMVMPPEGSATEQAQAMLGEGVKVVCAFQNVGAKQLEELDRDIPCDILVAGNDLEAKKIVIGLAEGIGCTAYNAGLAESARCIEALTSILIRLSVAKAYPHLKHAGIRLVS